MGVGSFSLARVFHDRLLALEQRLVFQPTPQLKTSPSDYGLEYRRLELTTRDGVGLMAWLLPSKVEDPWLLYLHGNGGNVADYLALTATLKDACGLNVLMLEYRGYGESEGAPSEQGLYADADAAYDWMRAEGVAPDDIFVYGFSLGSAVAIDLAVRREATALITEAAFTSIPDMGRVMFPLLPKGLVKNRFDSLSKMPALDLPVLMLHSEDDRSVPFQQGRRLHQQAPPGTEFVTYKGNHAVLLSGELPPRVQKALLEFTGQKKKAATPPSHHV